MPQAAPLGKRTVVRSSNSTRAKKARHRSHRRGETSMPTMDSKSSATGARAGTARRGLRAISLRPEVRQPVEQTGMAGGAVSDLGRGAAWPALTRRCHGSDAVATHTSTLEFDEQFRPILCASGRSTSGFDAHTAVRKMAFVMDRPSETRSAFPETINAPNFTSW